MKKLLLLLALLGLSSASSAQIYRAGGYYNNESVVVSPWEISAGIAGLYAPLKELSGLHLMNLQGGVSLRPLYYITPWAALGPEGSWTWSESGSTSVKKYTVRRVGAAGKFVFPGESSARTYGIIAAGLNDRKVEFDFNRNERKSSAYFAFGLGLETEVWDGFFTGLEVRAVYNTSTELGFYTHLVSRWEAEVSVRAGIRF